MVPRISARGHSFKGAGQYYLHDKQAQTKERVVWTHTHNLPTDDADKAFKWMAYTAMNAGRLKAAAGGSHAGRKSKAGSVYSFSLAWHPEQNPDKETMLDSALTTMDMLGLSEHEAVMVAHNDREHPHVHVILNLVHPESGKTAVPSYDRLTLSRWAEGLEKNDGKIYCEQRVINNEKRRALAGQDRQLALVKHREERLDIAQLVQDIYERSGTAAEFQAAMQEQGYTLAAGNRRAFVLVDETGKISSLSRQLKGQRAKDLADKLSGLKDLPQAAELAKQRQSVERKPPGLPRLKEDYDEAVSKSQLQKPPPAHKKPPPPGDKILPPNDDHLRRLDELREWEFKTDTQRRKLEELQEKTYGRSKILKDIEDLKGEISKGQGLWNKVSGRLADMQDQLENLEKTLANIDQRIEEQNSAFKSKADETRPGQKDENRLKMEDYEQRMRQHREQSRDKGLDHDLER